MGLPTCRLGQTLGYADTGTVLAGADAGDRSAWGHRFAEAMRGKLNDAAPQHRMFADWSHLHGTVSDNGANDIDDARTRLQIGGRVLNAVIDAWQRDPCGVSARLLDVADPAVP